MNIDFKNDKVVVTEMRPGDCMVLTVQDHLNDDQRKRITNQVMQQLPLGSRVLIVDGGVGVAILRQQDVADAAVVYTTQPLESLTD